MSVAAFSHAPYDFAPALSILLLGGALALGPLAWLGWRLHHAGVDGRARHGLHALTLLTLFLVFDLVLFGAFTRLTDSGLGCPDWPGCYGHSSPLGAHAQISAAEHVLADGPVTHGKAWIEMVHRYLATGAGALITLLAALAWRQQRAARTTGTISAGWPLFTLFWVCMQGAFGALTVTWKLFPLIVTLHLLGGLTLLALLTVQAARYAQAAGQPAAMLPRPLRAGLLAVFALLVLQVALGGWVSTNYAVLACNGFPTCQGRWWPALRLADLAQGFAPWRELGYTPAGALLPFAALTGIHYLHRLLACAVLAALLLLAWRLYRQGALRRQARWLAALVLWQCATGISNVVFNWPLLAALAHTGGAAALVLVLTWSTAASRSGTAKAGP